MKGSPGEPLIKAHHEVAGFSISVLDHCESGRAGHLQQHRFQLSLRRGHAHRVGLYLFVRHHASLAVRAAVEYALIRAELAPDAKDRTYIQNYLKVAEKKMGAQP